MTLGPETPWDPFAGSRGPLSSAEPNSPQPVQGLWSASNAVGKNLASLPLTADPPMFIRKSEALSSRSPGKRDGIDLPPTDRIRAHTARKEDPMLRRSELPLSELPAFDDDPALFDPSPEWFVPGLKASLGEDEDDDDDGDELGFRLLIEQPEALSKAWRATGGDGSGSRVRRAKRRAEPKQRATPRSPELRRQSHHPVRRTDEVRKEECHVVSLQ